MYEMLVENRFWLIAAIVAVSALVVYICIKVIQKVGLETVRSVAYKGFVSAEHAFKQGENQEKFNYVVGLVTEALPFPFNLVISENLLRKVVQLWFDLCKDLLDDGKFNGTGIERSDSNE